MAINLLDLFKDQLSDGVLGSVSNLLGGDDSSSVQKGLMAAAPALLGGLMDKASTEGGAKEVFNMLGDGSALSNIAGVLGAGGNQTQGFLNTGLGFVKAILGDKAAGIIDMISSVAGLGNSSSSSLLSIAGSVLGGVLGKQKASGLDLGGMVNMLSNQGSFLEKAAPTGLASLLGLANFSGLTDKLGGLASGALGFAGDAAGKVGDAGKAAAGAAADAGKAAFDGAKNVAGSAADLAGDTVEAGGSMMKKILPILLGLVGLAFAFYLIKGCDGDKSAMDNIKDAASETTGAVKGAADKVGDVAGDAVDATKDAANAVGNAAADAADKVGDVAGGVLNEAGEMVNAFGQKIGKFFEWALPNGTKLNIPEGGFEANFLNFLKDGKMEAGKYYAFDRLYFETGSAKVDQNSKDQIDNVAAILKAYPDTKVLLRGHTDNTGNAAANMKLSEARAFAVKAELVRAGIKGDRIAIKGMGPNEPIADNATTEGKAQNRRIDISIEK